MAASQLGYTPGSGAQVATDQDSGGAHHQKALTEHLVDGVPTPTSETNPLPTISDRTDNFLALLGRIVKLLESSAVVDSAQRQRVVIDSGSITASIAATQTLSTVTTVGTVSTVTAANNLVANAGMDREQYINIAKQTYAESIRSRLTFQ